MPYFFGGSILQYILLSKLKNIMLYLSLINTTTAVEVNDDFTMLWILLSGILVFFMQAGFTLVESGFTRSKNAVNISMKNILDISVGTLSYWFIGYGLMYGSSNGWIATSDIRLKNVESYVSGGLIIVNNLTPIKYTWKDKNSSKLHIGLSAQEVLKYVPEAVYGSEETKYGVSYGKLVPVLIDAVKELTTRIEELENQLEDKN